MTLVLAIEAVSQTWPRQQRAIATVLTLVVATFAITALPGVKHGVHDQIGAWPVMTTVHRLLPQKVQSPALVLFPFLPGDNFSEEPVYNVDVAWPDDAPIIHAQELGIKRDQEIAGYYARTQPGRNVYVFDRRRFAVIPMGKPKDFLTYLVAAEAATRRQANAPPAAR